MNINKALEAQEGFLVENGPFYTGGAASPIGLDLPVNTVYAQESTTGFIVWRKYGAGVNDWISLDRSDFRYYASSSAEDLTTSTTFQTKVTMTHTLAAGTYRVQFSFLGRESGANSEPEYRVNFDGAQIWILTNPIDTGKNAVYSGFSYVTLATTKSVVINIQYRNRTNGRTTFISEAWLEVLRVS